MEASVTLLRRNEFMICRFLAIYKKGSVMIQFGHFFFAERAMEASVSLLH